MDQRRETPHPPVGQLVTGHFHEKQGYYAYRPGGTDDWLLILTLGGSGRFGYAGGEAIARPGDMTLLRPQAPHDYGVEPKLRRWELLWTHFNPRHHWLEWLAWPECAPGLMRLHLPEGEVRREITTRFLEAHAYAAGAFRRREMFAMNALEEVLLRCDTINPLSEQSRIDPRVREAMEHCCRHFDRRITLDSLAETVGLSVSRLAHLFREQTGTTPQRFIERQRIGRARQLLEWSAMSIGEIAEAVGFENPFYFSLRFRKSEGISPKAHRAKRFSRPAPPG